MYLVVGGTGTVTVIRDGESKDIPVSGPPTLRQIVGDDEVRRGTVEVRLSPRAAGVLVHLRLNQAGRKVRATPFMQ